MTRLAENLAGARSRYGAALVIGLMIASLVLAPPARAFIFVTPAPSFPDTVVGETAPAALGINNSSTPPESVSNPVLTISNIDLYPACTSSAVDCAGGVTESGVYALSSTGTGIDGPTCTGTWTIVPNTGDPTTATSYQFIPPGGEGTLQLATGETCVVNFTITTLRVPTNDVNPAVPGVQTNHVASSNATGPTIPPPGPRNSGVDQSTVAQATPGLATVAAQSSAAIPGTTTDTATLSPPPPPSSGSGAPPTGTITFNLFGPNNPTCTGAPIFTDTVPVNGFGDYTTSTAAPITAPGTYNWTATYSGDANYIGSGPVGCGDPAEQVTFAQAQPAIVTVAGTGGPVGTPISDVATLSGGFNPTGTITFNAYGPNDPTCAGPPVFTSTVPVNGNGDYDSGTFTPTAAGDYNWTATYSGDANNLPATSPCGAPNETSTITRVQPTIVTSATPTVTVGQPIMDTATLSGGQNPTGTITFTLFGPNNPTCTGAPIFTSTVPVTGNGPYTSDPFTPTQAGTYEWVAAYSGDANNEPATSPCGAPNEQSVVQPAQPSITTLATQNAAVGDPITDTATLSGGQNPTGTITFTLFGPNDPTCAGAPIFTDTVPVNGNGQYTSGPFTPTQPGSYNWVAEYSGDANNAPAATACGDPGETTPVTTFATELTTRASGPVTLSQPITDTATLVGFNPTGTITFTLFGPNNPTCAGAPIFTSTVPVNGNGDYVSGPFTPTQPGNYQWIATYSGDANNAPAQTSCADPLEVSVVTPLPTVQVVKTADPLSRPEPGGDFTYTVVVTNTSNENLTITSLNDNVYGDLATRPGSTCGALIGTTLAPGASSPPCTFTGTFTGDPGDSLTDVVTVVATNPSGVQVSDTDDAVVNITPVAPEVQVVKTADPLSRPEPGGDFTYTVVVTNTSTVEALTITSLNDNVYGDLATRPGSTCGALIGTTLAPGATSAPCTFTAPFTGNAGDSLTDVVTVVGVDDDGQTATDDDDAVVTLTDVLPTITVVKTADPLTRPEPGGDFTFTVVVTNTSIEPVMLTSLTDDVYGNLDGRGTCDVTPPPTLAPTGGTYTCQFVGPFTGPPGATQTDTVTATAVDDDGNTATAEDDAVVSITNVLPSILVEKDATPASLPEPGGDFTFNVRVINNGPNAITITSLTDDIYGNLANRGTCTTAVGTVLQPGGSYTCSFTGAFTGVGGQSQTDTVTATGVDASGDTVSDTDDATVTLTNVAPTVQVDKTANPLSRPEPGGDFTYTVVVTNTSNEPVTITSLTDNVYGDLTTRGTCTNAIGTVLQPSGTYTCQFTAPFTGTGGASLTDVVTVTVVDNQGTTATDSDDATVTITNVPPTVQVDKTANPTSRPEPGGDFTFTVVVTNTSNEPVTISSLTDDIHGNLASRGTCTTAVGTVLPPGGTYTCAFTATFLGDAGASQTDIVTVVVRDDEGSTATDTDDATVTITNVPPTVLVEKTADPLSRPEPGGTFTFFVLVTNTSNEPVTITSLVDDVYGNLNGRGTCAVGAVLAPAPGPGNTYSCTFPGSFFADAGARQTDTVTVTVVDNENTPATDSDTATVEITDVLPTIAVTKLADPGSLPVPGGTFTFTVGVTNTSNEAVTITSLVDDVYGDLNGRGTCAIGAVLQPGETYTCSFQGDFRGKAGDSQVDTVTAVAVDNEGNRAVAEAQAKVRLEEVAKKPPIAFTGGQADRTARIASGFLFAGALLVLATWRSGGGPDLGFLFAGGGGGGGGRGPGGLRGPRVPGGRGGPGGWGLGLRGPAPRDGGDSRSGPMAFSGAPGSVLPRTSVPPPDPLDAIFRPPAPRKPAARTTPPALTDSSVLASGFGLARGGSAPAPPATSRAARAALRNLGLHLRR